MKIDFLSKGPSFKDDRYKKAQGNMDEKALIYAAQNGDIDSFNLLVLRYQDLAYTQAVWILKNSFEAEDCTQEAFIKAYQRLYTYRGGSFKSWLLRIVINTCLDFLRQRRRVEVLSITPQNEDGEENDLSDLLVDPGSSVEELVERSELRSLMRRYFDELSDEYRETVYLVDVLEFDYHEAAQALGVPMGTVKSRLARARRQLRERLLSKPELLTQFIPANVTM